MYKIEYFPDGLGHSNLARTSSADYTSTTVEPEVVDAEDFETGHEGFVVFFSVVNDSLRYKRVLIKAVPNQRVKSITKV
jgi:hypothetical protein